MCQSLVSAQTTNQQARCRLPTVTRVLKEHEHCPHLPRTQAAPHPLGRHSTRPEPFVHTVATGTVFVGRGPKKYRFQMTQLKPPLDLYPRAMRACVYTEASVSEGPEQLYPRWPVSRGIGNMLTQQDTPQRQAQRSGMPTRVKMRGLSQAAEQRQTDIALRGLVPLAHRGQE